ncbi:MAG: DUF167 domain-containing protein [Chitinispirillaceae bacterium]|nr:DUF167 domain-containing protein [Chitinispirillaceae bacterium]
MGETGIAVRLKPRSKSDWIRAGTGNALEAGVTSPPVDDRANEHLLRLVAKRLRVPKRSVVILKGFHSRDKVIAVEGMTREEAMRKLTVKN